MNIARARRRKEARLLAQSLDSERFDKQGRWAAPPEPWTRLPEERLVGKETLEKVREAIDQLPTNLRDVILLRDVAGWDSDEVSRLLEITPANQRVRLHRARAAVRQALEDYLS
jgi:RNA polymerase sigma-70 factor (ECF subfamily)